jgi:hypothetical protein
LYCRAERKKKKKHPSCLLINSYALPRDVTRELAKDLTDDKFDEEPKRQV